MVPQRLCRPGTHVSSGSIILIAPGTERLHLTGYLRSRSTNRSLPRSPAHFGSNWGRGVKSARVQIAWRGHCLVVGLHRESLLGSAPRRNLPQEARARKLSFQPEQKEETAAATAVLVVDVGHVGTRLTAASTGPG